ncbi:hypothetical protein EIN_267890 [Entamoeba invadens IP1]|uniref:PUM-HD domain-containing protein n=1 Tax=Entamoeba invadens IP1 TaxID=370355 RepID=A0A0A1U828_ENTIV|nr:hypothetical protein EIN_267890 [Entamoeba invadens IP1]ELP91053.1 hypothetical protein EIN_267890 [Entamoeba invadens IP1]|eukprot:XP_004257824.1 hypothetical protein EIN_267890 [Entamoeba invadens IP1]
MKSVNPIYTSEFVKSFESSHQKHFEELETSFRNTQRFLKMYQDCATQCRRLISRMQPTTETQKVLSQLTLIENLVRKEKAHNVQFDTNNNEIQEKEKPHNDHIKIIKPTQQELEKIAKSTSMPLLHFSIQSKMENDKKAHPKLIASEFVGQFNQMTRYTSGCAILQKILSNPSQEIVQMIFDEVESDLDSLIIHPNGQHILPQMAEFGSEEVQDAIYNTMAKDLVKYCCHQFGGYTAQKVAPYMKKRHIAMWAPTLRNNMALLAIDPHGNYVIQTLLKIFSDNDVDFFYNGMQNCVTKIAKTKVGCSVLTHAMESSSQSQIDKIKPKLIEDCCDLIQDQFGNFVIQRLIDCDASVVPAITRYIAEDAVFYSKQKFSSNVVEKCLKCGGEEEVSILIDALLNTESVSVLIEDQFGNFVIQALLDVVPESKRVETAQRLMPFVPANSRFTYHIEKKLLQLY